MGPAVQNAQTEIRNGRGGAPELMALLLGFLRAWAVWLHCTEPGLKVSSTYSNRLFPETTLGDRRGKRKFARILVARVAQPGIVPLGLPYLYVPWQRRVK